MEWNLKELEPLARKSKYVSRFERRSGFAAGHHQVYMIGSEIPVDTDYTDGRDKTPPVVRALNHRKGKDLLDSPEYRGLRNELDAQVAKGRLSSKQRAQFEEDFGASNSNWRDLMRDKPLCIFAWKKSMELGLPNSWRRDAASMEVYQFVLFNSYLKKHIFKGHKKRRSDGSINRITGVHHVSALNYQGMDPSIPPKQGDQNYKPGTKQPADAGPDEVWKAEPQVYGLNKSTTPATEEWRSKQGNDGESTFFPDNWSRDKILYEVAYVRVGLTTGDKKAGNTWYQRLNSELTFEIAMFVDDINILDSRIGSAFPLLNPQ